MFENTIAQYPEFKSLFNSDKTYELKLDFFRTNDLRGEMQGRYVNKHGAVTDKPKKLTLSQAMTAIAAFRDREFPKNKLLEFLPSGEPFLDGTVTVTMQKDRKSTEKYACLELEFDLADPIESAFREALEF